jgi:diguanylate cyclase (GGDEF)-like protein
VPTQFQLSILHMMAADEAAEATAERICRQAESFRNGVLCSMVTVDRTGHLHPFAGPSLPDRYSAALDGIPIGPEVGSCGSAAFLRKAVAVTDIFTDHRWSPYKDLAEPLAVRACWSSPILGGDGRVIGAFGFYYRDSRGPSSEDERIVAECTELSAILLDRREIRAENYLLSYTDVLSGLGNRVSFEKALAEVLRGAGNVGLLLVDIDELKRVNDDFGNATGDLLIREVGRRLDKNVWPARAFRIGGGEFAVLFDDQDAERSMSRSVARIQMAMREAAQCEGHLLSPFITCGGATLGTFDARDPGMLWRHASLALRNAKATARGGFVLFRKHLAAAGVRRSQALQTATRALAEHRVEAHYQPIVQLDTRQVIGLEALFRVRTPQGGVVRAGQLAGAMSAPSTASLITDRMLALVARDLRRWLDRGIRLQHVSVNVSMADFRRGDLRERIVAAFSRHAVPLSHLLLEVTETVPLDDGDSKIASAIEQLRADGVRMALDDFGTGYASLTHLVSFPVDVIKTDKSLLDRMAPGDAGETIMAALLQMARGLGIRILAEGVENSAQAAQLERLGCEFAQGYFFGRPATAEAITEMLQDLGAGGPPKGRGGRS